MSVPLTQMHAARMKDASTGQEDIPVNVKRATGEILEMIVKVNEANSYYLIHR